AARAQTLAALGVAGSATLVAGAAQAAPLGTLAKLGWSKLLAAVSLVGAAAAVPGYYAWQHHQRSAAHGVAASAVVALRPVETQTPVAAGPAAAVAPAAPVVAANEAPARPVRRTAPSSVTLAHELSSIDAARGMLARGDAAGALARLDAYTRAYPHGRLGLESEVLRIDALEQNGQGDAAHTRAEAFLQRHPHSVLAARVRARLAD
ncbi:MAG TPA: hypothetical protein VKZ18_19740, partial [Polyangia bacterium]|nr:hypothetical protein [Polyangia bacterium]